MADQDFIPYTPPATPDFIPVTPPRGKGGVLRYDYRTGNTVDEAGNIVATSPSSKPIRMGLAGGGRGSEAEEAPPETMRVGRLVHKGESTSRPNFIAYRPPKLKGPMTVEEFQRRTGPQSIEEGLTTPFGMGRDIQAALTVPGNSAIANTVQLAQGMAVPKNAALMAAAVAAPEAVQPAIATLFAGSMAPDIIADTMTGHPVRAAVQAGMAAAPFAKRGGKVAKGELHDTYGTSADAALDRGVGREGGFAEPPPSPDTLPPSAVTEAATPTIKGRRGKSALPDVDNSGRAPQILYHGSQNTNLKELSPGHAEAFGNAIYLGADPKSMVSEHAKGGRVYEVELDPSAKLFNWDDLKAINSLENTKAVTVAARLRGIDPQDIIQEYPSAVNAAIRELGFDGVKMTSDEYGTEYAIFNKNKVRIKQDASALPDPGVKPTSTLQSSLIPGAEEFVAQDVAPAIEGVKAAPSRIRTALGALFNPAGVSEEAGQTARILRANAGEMARENEVAANTLSAARNHFRKTLIAQPPERSGVVDLTHPTVAFTDAVENGRPTGNEGLDAVAASLREALDKAGAEAERLGIMKRTIDDYLGHIWEKPGVIDNIKARFGGRRPFEGSEDFTKQRSIPTILDGLKAGLKPVTYNPIEMQLLKLREINKSIMAHKSFNEMKGAGLARFVRFGGDVPEGFTQLNDKIARVLERQDTTKADGTPGAPQFVMRGNYYAPDAAAKVFNNYLSPGLRGNVFFDVANGVSNVMNQAQLGLSAFHLMFTSLDAATSKLALGLQQVSEGKIKAGATNIVKGNLLYAPVETYLRGSRGVKAYFDPHLSATSPLRVYIDALQQAGGRVKMDSFYHNSAAESFWHALENHNYPGAVLRAPFALLHAASYPIMQHIVPRQKMGVFMDMARYELERLPENATLDQQRKVLSDAWDSVDNRMGQLVYDNLFWNRAVKDLGLVGTRSLGWNLGTVREIGGGVKDIGGTYSRVKGGGPVLTRRMSYTMALPMQVALTGGVLYYLANGKPPPTLRDYFQPTINGVRVQPASYMRDIIPGIVAYRQEGLQGLGMKLKEQAQAKVNPGLQTIIEMLNNEDYFGNKIRNDKDPWVKRAEAEADFVASQFLPFALRDNPYHKATTKKERALQFLGITRVPKDRTERERERGKAFGLLKRNP